MKQCLIIFHAAHGRMYGCDASMPYNVELAIRLIGSNF
jgi:hypothetical protein